jgi:hypothetical protein
LIDIHKKIKEGKSNLFFSGSSDFIMNGFGGEEGRKGGEEGMVMVGELAAIIFKQIF